jgi:hypothetical protein
MKSVMNKRKFTINDGQFFAKCTGDYNPVHIDPIVSRRYMFGEPIVHGLHVVLWALEVWFGHKDEYVKLISLNVSFPKAVVLEKTTVCNLINESDNQSTIEVSQNDVVCAKIKLTFNRNEQDILEINDSWIIDGNPPKAEPKDFKFEELKNKTGILDQYLKKDKFSRVFPNVIKFINRYHIATLLSSTRLIGMHCPGLNSLISSLEFSFIRNVSIEKKLNYKVSKLDERFNMLFINLSALNFSGKIRTFIRPSPVDQLKFTEVVGHIKPNEFKGQKVLVVGGSRGLGEITTKILVAGGASVRFTYNKGLVDAEKIRNEILSNNRSVDIIKLDVIDVHNYSSVLNDGWIPTHCYYFPTPFIFSGVKGMFSESLFNQFNSVYVTSFIKLFNFLKQKGTLNYFYPSTTAIDEMPDNMVEYTISKYSAQKICEILRNNDESIKIEMYKFPRMETDQTVSFLPVRNHDPLKITLSFIRSFNAVTI